LIRLPSNRCRGVKPPTGLWYNLTFSGIQHPTISPIPVETCATRLIKKKHLRTETCAARLIKKKHLRTETCATRLIKKKHLRTETCATRLYKNNKWVSEFFIPFITFILFISFFALLLCNESLNRAISKLTNTIIKIKKVSKLSKTKKRRKILRLAHRSLFLRLLIGIFKLLVY
jgi:ATP-dependent Zn protease